MRLLTKASGRMTRGAWWALALLTGLLSAGGALAEAKLGEACGQRGQWSAACEPHLRCEIRERGRGSEVGVCVQGERACGGLLGAGCAEGEFCDYAPEAMCGAADQTGICRPRPSACTFELRPVCGCDDETYPNACAAHAAGVSVIGEGSCDECVEDEDCPHGACDQGVTCAGIDCPPPPPSRCTTCGDGSQLTCKRALVPCPAGQVREIVDGCYGACVDRHSCEPAARACSYEGKRYRVGESFPAKDGCNTCSCDASGRVMCTLKLCSACERPDRKFVSRSADQCRMIRFACEGGTRPFFDSCGCGCEPSSDKPEPPSRPAPSKCQVGGCSGQLCIPAGSGGGITTCEWRDEYACYRDARCEVQPSGQCGWTPTEELRACLADGRSSR